MYINVEVGTVEADQSSFQYITYEGNGWNLFTAELGETSCNGCLCNPQTLKKKKKS